MNGHLLSVGRVLPRLHRRHPKDDTCARGVTVAASGTQPARDRRLPPKRSKAQMKVLVTGGSGVVGESAVRELNSAGHAVRVLTRHAGRDQKWWPAGIEGWAGDVSNERSIRGAADGCDVVMHI